jgi:hypothetical protein
VEVKDDRVEVFADSKLVGVNHPAKARKLARQRNTQMSLLLLVVKLEKTEILYSKNKEKTAGVVSRRSDTGTIEPAKHNGS